MARKDNFFQLDRYYLFERNSLYCVGYFHKGTNLQLTEEFKTIEERSEFIKVRLDGFSNITYTTL